MPFISWLFSTSLFQTSSPLKTEIQEWIITSTYQKCEGYQQENYHCRYSKQLKLLKPLPVIYTAESKYCKKHCITREIVKEISIYQSSSNAKHSLKVCGQLSKISLGKNRPSDYNNKHSIYVSYKCRTLVKPLKQE